MIKNHYDLIVTTGCSHSCGMEMNDHLLPAARTVKERETNIIQWCKSNYKLPEEDSNTLKDHAFEAWEDQERKESWPTLLQNTLKHSCGQLSPYWCINRQESLRLFGVSHTFVGR